MKKLAHVALCALITTALSAGAFAQCSDLTVGGTLTGGGTADFTVTGAPADSPTVVLVGTSAGTTSIGGLVTLGLEAPFVPVAIGSTDANGDFSATIDIPSLPMGAPFDPLDLKAQALTIEFGGGPPTGGGGLPFTICTSDVECFTVTL